jgi:hypothetical protein
MHRTHSGKAQRGAAFCDAAFYFGGVNRKPKKEGSIMFDRLHSALGRLRPRSIAEQEHRYLSAAVSLIDLERREREIDQGLFRRSVFDR